MQRGNGHQDSVSGPIVRAPDPHRPGKTRTGIDWKWVVALIMPTFFALGLLVSLGGERRSVLDHVAKGDVALVEWTGHKADRSLHLSEKDREAIQQIPVLVERLSALTETARRIERKIDNQGR